MVDQSETGGGGTDMAATGDEGGNGPMVEGTDLMWTIAPSAWLCWLLS